MPIQTQMYQPRIPIGSGGGVIDLSSKENESKRLIAQVLAEALGNIAKKPQQEQVKGILVTSENNLVLMNPQTGEVIIDLTKELGLAPPKSGAGRNVMDAYRDLSALSGYEDKGGLTAIEPEIVGQRKSALRQEIMRGQGYRPPPTEHLRTKEAPGVLSEIGRGALGPVPKGVESKEIPPKPKGYPDAKWNDEHQMWTIIKNGRLMGVK